MRTWLKLLWVYGKLASLQDAAFRANLLIGVLHGVLGFATALGSVFLLYNQAPVVNGWAAHEVVTLLGVYTLTHGVIGVFIGPSLEQLVEQVIDGSYDFVLLKPVKERIHSSVRVWRPVAVTECLLGFITVVAGMSRSVQSLTWGSAVVAVAIWAASVVTVYSILLFLASLAFYFKGSRLSWIFDSMFLMARYPVDIYPSWFRVVLTWVVPVAFVTTVPARALNASLSATDVLIALVVAVLANLLGTRVFDYGLRRYTSATG